MRLPAERGKLKNSWTELNMELGIYKSPTVHRASERVMDRFRFLRPVDRRQPVHLETRYDCQQATSGQPSLSKTSQGNLQSFESCLI
jgi:hypothetical protein